MGPTHQGRIQDFGKGGRLQVTVDYYTKTRHIQMHISDAFPPIIYKVWGSSQKEGVVGVGLGVLTVTTRTPPTPLLDTPMPGHSCHNPKYRPTPCTEKLKYRILYFYLHF